MQIPDVNDDDADAQLEEDAGDQQRQYEVVEPVSLASDVKQQLELGDLRQRQDGDESRLCLRLGLLELAVAREKLQPIEKTTECVILPSLDSSNALKIDDSVERL